MFEEILRKLKRKSKREIYSRHPKTRRLQGEHLEDRALLTAVPLGALPTDTGEFLLGRVAVTPVFFESNGQIDTETQDWTSEEIDAVLAKVTEGVGWWSDLLDTLDTVHELDFVIDDTFARNPYSTPYEPIDRPSTDLTLYAAGFLLEQGQGNATSLEEAVYGFNHLQREKLDTDWSFTIFVVDSSDDPDGLFASGGTFAGAFAYAGGLFFVTPSTRPASTIAHEMGHIFWARDEYPGASSWTDRRGYYDTQNVNAADNPTPGFQQEISIMRGGVPLNQAYDSLVSPESTLAMIGWQDTDQDGIFDVADVPLSLLGNGFYDAENLTYRLVGSAQAVPLINQNSSGNQSDITLNRISEIQYRLDGGDWVTASSPDAQKVSIDLSIPMSESFSTIEWRAIDITTGVASGSLMGSDLEPAVQKTGLTGLTYFDENADQAFDSADSVLSNTSINLTQADGSPLYFGDVAAEDLPSGSIDNSGLALELVTVSEINSGPVAVELSSRMPGTKTFHYYNALSNRWVDHWNEGTALQVNLEADVGTVSVQMYGYQSSSYGRLEAYNAEGQLIQRVTSEELQSNEQAELRIDSADGEIRSVRVFGYAGSSVIVDAVEFGFNPELVTDEQGVWQVPFLPAGQYRADYLSEKVIYEFPPEGQLIEVNHAEYQIHPAAAIRVDSPKHNTQIAEDANEDGLVSAVDALVVINDLNRYSVRDLTRNDPSLFKVDVNNDGTVSALDALVVINALSTLTGPSGELVTGETQSLSQPSPAGSLEPTPFSWCYPSVEPVLGVALVDSEDSELGSESIDSLHADSIQVQVYGPIMSWHFRQIPIGSDRSFELDERIVDFEVALRGIRADGFGLSD